MCIQKNEYVQLNGADTSSSSSLFSPSTQTVLLPASPSLSTGPSSSALLLFFFCSSSALLLLQCCVHSASALIAELPSLLTLPLAIVPANSGDAQLPTVGWAEAAARTFVQRVLTLSTWISDTVHLARLSTVPFANLTHFSSAPLCASDVCYTRVLHQNSGIFHVIWQSQTRRPDLGDSFSAVPLPADAAEHSDVGLKTIGIGESAKGSSNSSSSSLLTAHTSSLLVFRNKHSITECMGEQH